MAIPLVQPSVDEERGETILRDRFGEPIVTLRSITRTESNGNSERKTRDLLVSNPPVYITCCDLCRRPPWRLFSAERRTHGLLTLENAEQCHRCGKVLCPRHRVEFGSVIRCVSCARWRRLWNAFLFLFAREE